MQIGKPLVVTAAVAALAVTLLWARPDAQASSGRALVTSLVEAHDTATDRGILYVGGKRLRRFRRAQLLGEFGEEIGEFEILRQTGAEITLGMPPGQSSGLYRLRLSARRGDPCELAFAYRATYVDFDRLSQSGLTVQNDNPFHSIWGINFGDGYGVGAAAQSADAVPLLAERLTGAGSGDLAHFVHESVTRARIDADGTGIFNGGTQTGGADFAESVTVNAPKQEFEPGDVMVIDPRGERRFALSRVADSPLVAGIHSTRPGVLARPGEVVGGGDWAAHEVPLAITGIVPCKVCDEGGPIRAGDLLVSASVPGHAKKAPPNPRPGTLVGKALGRLDGERGRVEVLITMR